MREIVRDSKRDSKRESKRVTERERSQSVACAEVQAGAFKALASLAPTKNLPNGQTLWCVFQDESNETRKQTRACELVHHWRCSKLAASGAHARQASVNEPSGARLFGGFWVES